MNIAIGISVSLLLSLCVAGCVDTRSQPKPQERIAVAGPKPTNRYFQRRLIAENGDPNSDFNGALAALGLDYRRLQAMPIEQAYSISHAATTKLFANNVANRRKFLLILFDETEE
jgi:hypothetical protein